VWSPRHWGRPPPIGRTATSRNGSSSLPTQSDRPKTRRKTHPFCSHYGYYISRPQQTRAHRGTDGNKQDSLPVKRGSPTGRYLHCGLAHPCHRHDQGNELHQQRPAEPSFQGDSGGSWNQQRRPHSQSHTTCTKVTGGNSTHDNWRTALGNNQSLRSRNRKASDQEAVLHSSTTTA